MYDRGHNEILSDLSRYKIICVLKKSSSAFFAQAFKKFFIGRYDKLAHYVALLFSAQTKITF